MNDKQGVITTILADNSGLLAVLIIIILVFAFTSLLASEICQWAQTRLKCRRQGHAFIEFITLEPHMLSSSAGARRKRRIRRCYTEEAMCSRCGRVEEVTTEKKRR